MLEESWKDWPFPSQAVMTDICGQTSLNVQTVISWFVKKNKTELRNILPDSNNKFSDKGRVWVESFDLSMIQDKTNQMTHPE